jgi:hypothetical protein
MGNAATTKKGDPSENGKAVFFGAVGGVDECFAVF